jgi:DNA-binding transcriptional regulator YhcF (GntR family)
VTRNNVDLVVPGGNRLRRLFALTTAATLSPSSPVPSSYQSISAQVADTLRAELRNGSWRRQLPGERLLAERLSVSRKTVRKALAMLRAEGFIRTERSRGSAIMKSPNRKRTGPIKTVVLLLPEPLEGARPFTVLWVNHLMAMLHEAGMQLETVAGWKYFGARAGRSLPPDRIMRCSDGSNRAGCPA